MSVRLCYRESMRRKDGKSKGTIKTAVGIHTYRNEKGETIRRKFMYRKIVRKS